MEQVPMKQENILVHPGFFFDFPSENVLVLSLIVEEKAFRTGVDRLCETLRKVL